MRPPQNRPAVILLPGLPSSAELETWRAESADLALDELFHNGDSPLFAAFCRRADEYKQRRQQMGEMERVMAEANGAVAAREARHR